MRMAAWLAVLTAGGLALWIGVPLVWLWIGSQIQGSTDSLGLAMAAMVPGAIGSMVGLVGLLGRVTCAYQRARVARGLDDTGNFPLEVVLVCSALVAGAVLLAWLLVG